MVHRITNRQDPVRDLRDVGTKKAMGYLYREDIEPLIGYDFFIQELRSQGKICLETISKLSEEQVLFVFDQDALAALLTSHKEVVESAGWPLDATEFVKRTGDEQAELNSKLFDVISWAYGNDPEVIRDRIAFEQNEYWGSLGAW